MFPYIVADVGGTNSRFALVTGKTGNDYHLEQVQIFKGAQYSSFDEVMAIYIESLGAVQATAACVAIAGPILGDQVTMTNLPWSFSQEALRKRFGLRAFIAINDFTAMAMASAIVQGDGLITVVNGPVREAANKAICGPGTGLGVAGLANDGRLWLPIPSEGGHVTLGPSTIDEVALLKVLIAQHGYVSAETCVSGPGLVNLYKAFAELNGVAADALQAHDISERALLNSDVLCRQALEQFCAFMGTVASNLALIYGAKGGVYLTGGILPRFVEFLKTSAFKERYLNKGVMSHYMADIPAYVMVHKQPAFVGAAAWLEQKLS